jgi:hypothetical protein
MKINMNVVKFEFLIKNLKPTLIILIVLCFFESRVYAACGEIANELGITDRLNKLTQDEIQKLERSCESRILATASCKEAMKANVDGTGTIENVKIHCDSAGQRKTNVLQDLAEIEKTKALKEQRLGDAAAAEAELAKGELARQKEVMDSRRETARTGGLGIAAQESVIAAGSNPTNEQKKAANAALDRDGTLTKNAANRSAAHSGEALQLAASANSAAAATANDDKATTEQRKFQETQRVVASGATKQAGLTLTEAAKTVSSDTTAVPSKEQNKAIAAVNTQVIQGAEEAKKDVKESLKAPNENFTKASAESAVAANVPEGAISDAIAAARPNDIAPATIPQTEVAQEVLTPEEEQGLPEPDTTKASQPSPPNAVVSKPVQAVVGPARAPAADAAPTAPATEDAPRASSVIRVKPTKQAKIYPGSPQFVDCQKNLGQNWTQIIAKPQLAFDDQQWINVVTNAPKVANDSQINFESSQKVGEFVEAESSAIAAHFSKIRECAAAAMVMTHVDFDDEDETMESDKSEYKSFDGRISCRTDGGETQDFPQCNTIVNLYNGAQVAKVGKDVFHQVSFAEKTGDAQTKALSNPMDPTGALKAQKTGIEAQHEIAEQNAVFEGAKLASLGAALSKLPSRKLLISECEQTTKPSSKKIEEFMVPSIEEAFFTEGSSGRGAAKKEAIMTLVKRKTKKTGELLIEKFNCTMTTQALSAAFSEVIKTDSNVTGFEPMTCGQLKKPDAFKECPDDFQKYCEQVEKLQHNMVATAVDALKDKVKTFKSESTGTGDYNQANICNKVVNNSGFTFIKNEKASDAVTQILVEAGMDMAKFTGMALILNNQEDKMNRAINGVNAFKPADFSYNLTDELTSLCQINPSARECFGGGGGQVGLVGTEFNIGGNGQATGDGKSINDLGVDGAVTGNGSSDRSGVAFGGVAVSDGAANQGGGLTDTVAAVGVEKKPAGAAAGAGGGGVGNVAAPSNNGAGAQGPAQPQGISPLGNKGQYGGSGAGSLAYGGGGGSGTRKPASNENPFADMMKGKNAGGGELNFRDPASSGVGDKSRSLFNMISTRYSVVNKDKRLAEYVEAK